MRVLIVGAGRVGSELAKRLSETGHSVTVVDKDGTKIDLLNEEADVEGIVGDITDPRFYHRELDLGIFDAVIAATDKDEVNIFVAAIAKIRGVRRIYVRVRASEALPILNSLGIYDAVVEPQIIANLLYSMIEGRTAPVIITSSLSGDYHLVATVVKRYSAVRGRRLEEALKAYDLEDKVKVIAVYDGYRILEPDEAGVLEDGYIVIMLVKEEAMKELNEIF
ncbi:MAG: TrkA family potassium uptake protein [Desulfurococcales archaeon]|nr:TrkA family potassium uptake protein [Desulfurococcales archaeon]